MRKPEREIFDLALEHIGLPGAECVFIDDVPNNIAAAEQAGLVGIVHRTFDETATALEALFPNAGWIHQRLR
jgi:putative hydrolase of the HAD superfamily